MNVFVVTVLGVVFCSSFVKCYFDTSESHESLSCQNLGGVCVEDDDDCHYHYVFSNYPLCGCCHRCCLPDVDENSCEEIGGYCYDPREHDCDHFITGLCPSSLIHRCCLHYPRPK